MCVLKFMYLRKFSHFPLHFTSCLILDHHSCLFASVSYLSVPITPYLVAEGGWPMTNHHCHHQHHHRGHPHYHHLDQRIQHHQLGLYDEYQ
ncbi:hypothetical protein TorRG33x02_325110 [Trema orientale]|uniref:Uncharacterized protein n=1 Tax=Trema orientale TaxID=63057 RepID=A0A2P5BDA0_TREOI|nr:hypothetical protein TorRG33x02_325110 [Trema orientale]